MKYILIYVFIFFQAPIYAQVFSLEDLIVLNQKNDLQLNGFLNRYNWKIHANYSQNHVRFYSKKISESPNSIEFIKQQDLHNYNDSFIELIVLDSMRWRALILEAEKLFKATHSTIHVKSDSIDVYVSDKYAFLFFRKTFRHHTPRYHVAIYNYDTYIELFNSKEYHDFWGK